MKPCTAWASFLWAAAFVASAPTEPEAPYLHEREATASQDAARVIAEWSKIPRREQQARMDKFYPEAKAAEPWPFASSEQIFVSYIQFFPEYEQTILSPLKSDPKSLFLDLGAYFAPEVRWLAWQGVPTDRLWAANLDNKILDLSLDFYQDRDRLPKKQLLDSADIQEEDSKSLGEVRGRVTHLYFKNLVHVFTKQEQKAVANNMLRLLRQDTDGPVYILAEDSLYPHPKTWGNGFYNPNKRVWKEMWKKLAKSEEWKDKIESMEVIVNKWPREKSRTWMRSTIKVTFKK